ncbi:MAG: alpha-glucosidase, partial [Sphingomonas sp.]
LLAFRHASEALMTGSALVIEASEAMLVIERTAPRETMLCAFNISDEAREWRPAQPDRWHAAETVGEVGNWRFGPYSAVIAREP